MRFKNNTLLKTTYELLSIIPKGLGVWYILYVFYNEQSSAIEAFISWWMASVIAFMLIDEATN
jgi:hypothetical protein